MVQNHIRYAICAEILQNQNTISKGENVKNILNKILPVIAVVLLAVPLVLTGCASKDPATADILKNSMTAMQKVTSYQAGINLTMDMTVTDNDGTQKVTVAMNGTCATDVQKKNSKTDMDVSMDIPVMGTQKATM
jgi:type IV pilus biogenesis protein CpaD/CtpE